MTRDEIIRMARELSCEIPSGPEGVEFFFYPDELVRFAALIAAAESEACARIADDEDGSLVFLNDCCPKTEEFIAAAIRVRGESVSASEQAKSEGKSDKMQT